MTLQNRTTWCLVARHCHMVRGWGAALRGLTGQPVPSDTALGLPRCPWVHTFGVRGPLDIAFCDRTGRVLRVVTLPPGRFSPWVRGAWLTWEMAGGTLAPFVSPGDILVMAAEPAPV